MNLETQSLHFRGQELWLTNQRSMYWPKEKALILSDIHLGKSQYFQSHGLGFPNILHNKDSIRLCFLLKNLSVEKIIIVGDLYHTGSLSEQVLWRDFLSSFNLEAWVILGNHDRLKAKLPDSKTSYMSQLQLQGILFQHIPDIQPIQHQICGHIHPGVRLGKGKDFLDLPCFLVSDYQIILPAFSEFSGLDKGFAYSSSQKFRRYIFGDCIIREV